MNLVWILNSINHVQLFDSSAIGLFFLGNKMVG